MTLRLRYLTLKLRALCWVLRRLRAGRLSWPWLTPRGQRHVPLGYMVCIARALFHFTRTCPLHATHLKDRPCSRTLNPSGTSITMRKRLRGFSDIYAMPSRPHWSHLRARLCLSRTAIIQIWHGNLPIPTAASTWSNFRLTHYRHLSVRRAEMQRERDPANSYRAGIAMNWEPSARQRGGNARKRQRFSTLSASTRCTLR
jgi:hypothetical protein